MSTRDSVGAAVARAFEVRGLREPDYKWISEQAGLNHQWAERAILGRDDAKIRRGSLLKFAAAIELNVEERSALERANGEEEGSLCATEAAEIHLSTGMSMRRAVVLLTAPTDPHKLPFRIGKAATRSGVVFGWHDVVARVTTPKNTTVLKHSDEMFATGALRTIETIPLRDDLPAYIDQDFKGAHLDKDYFWATIFVQALGTPGQPELQHLFQTVSKRTMFMGNIHMLTAAVAVGQFDAVVEVLAAKIVNLQHFVREAQKLSRERSQHIHTVTYFAAQWEQKAPGRRF
ncbi:MAG TPA: hypothetical protein VK730_08750 [Solirubrobacteraceae bacterium]|jgi:hypothetical protein|nr:hypothetical protein [Solirubrobacteraceae bacterium]